jgi:hypothetical protein
MWRLRRGLGRLEVQPHHREELGSSRCVVVSPLLALALMWRATVTVCPLEH